MKGFYMEMDIRLSAHQLSPQSHNPQAPNLSQGTGIANGAANGVSLAGVQPSQVEHTPKVGWLQHMKAQCGLCIRWSGIALNCAFGSNICHLKTHKHPPAELDEQTLTSLCDSLSHCLSHFLDDNPADLKAQNNNLQQAFTHMLCDHANSKAHLLWLNQAIQQLHQECNTQSMTKSLAPEFKHPLQEFLKTLSASPKLQQVLQFSNHLSLKQQQASIRKLDSFPLKQCGVFNKAITSVRQQIAEIPLISQLYTHLKAKNSAPQVAPRVQNTNTLIAHTKNLFLKTATTIDASLRLNPEDQVEFLKEDLATAQYLSRSVVQHIQHLKSSSAADNTDPSKLQLLLQEFFPQASQDIINKGTNRLAQSFGGYALLVDQLVQRLDFNQLQALKLNIEEFEPNLPHKCIKLATGLLKGFAQNKTFIEPHKQLAYENTIQLQGLGELGSQCLSYSTENNSQELKQALTSIPSCQILRNLGCQENFPAAFEQFKQLMPQSFARSFETFRKNYHLDTFSAITQALMPHFSNEELSGLLQHLPAESFELISSKTQDCLDYCGDPENNLITTLQAAAQDTNQLMHETIQANTALIKQLTQSPKSLMDLCTSAQIHIKNNSHAMPDHKKTSILYEFDQLKAIKDTHCAQYYKQLNSLLAEMGMPYDFQSIQLDPLLSSSTKALVSQPLKHSLIQIRSAIGQSFITSEIHKTLAEKLHPETGISLEKRKAYANLFVKTLADTPLETILDTNLTSKTLDKPIEKPQIDSLWRLTQDLIAVTDRTIRLDTHDAYGEPTELIFMEDGSAVDGEGRLLPKGDPDNLALREQHAIDAQAVTEELACHTRVRQLMKDNWSVLTNILVDYPTTQSFTKLLTQSMLPTDVQYMLTTLLDQLVPREMRQSALGQLGMKTMAQLNDTDKDFIIDQIPAHLFTQLSNQVTHLINDLEPYDQMPFFKEFADKLVISLGESHVIQKLAGFLTKGYFTNINHADRRHIANAVLALGCPPIEAHSVNGQHKVSPAGMTELISAIAQSGGPGFQKAMQLFQGDIPITSIRNALDNMSSAVDPMADHQVRDIITTDLQGVTGPNGEQYRLDAKHNPADLKVLGSATIAQTVAARLTLCDQQGNAIPNRAPIAVAIKVQRPLIRHRIIREMQGLQRIPGVTPSVARTLKELEQSIVAETDFKREFQFGQLMDKLYTSGAQADNTIPGIKATPGIKVTPMIGQAKRILIQGFVPGQSIDKTWQQQSAEYQLSFTDNDALSKPAGQHQLQVVSHDGVPMQLRLFKSATAEPQLYNLSQSPLLQKKLAHFQRQYPQGDYAVARLLVHEMQHLFQLPPISTAQTFAHQAQFVNTVGKQLESLIANFANAAFFGKDSASSELQFISPHNLSAQARKNTMYLYESAQNILAIKVFDSHGKLARHWISSHPSTHTENAELRNHRLLNPQQQQFQAQLLELIEKQRQKGKPFANLGRSLDLKTQGELHDFVREVTGENKLFKGESFIDSDRHTGNMIYNNGQLTCIDTGAGTIVNEYKRKGMLKMAAGLATTNTDILFAGLESLIPELHSLTQNNSKAFRKDLTDSIRGDLVEHEKITELYEYLLRFEIVDGTERDEVFFHDLLTDPAHSQLKQRILDFNRPDEALQSLKQYLNFKSLDLKSPHISSEVSLLADFKNHLQQLDYGRVFSQNPQRSWNPTHWLTDGHNSLLFIKSVRKIANVLDEHGIYAPEAIIQLNRGTKFIDDQLKQMNVYKAELKSKTDAIRVIDANHSLLNQHDKNFYNEHLKPSSIGSAYLNGLASVKAVSDTLSAVGWRIFGLVGSYTSERAAAVGKIFTQ